MNRPHQSSHSSQKSPHTGHEADHGVDHVAVLRVLKPAFCVKAFCNASGDASATGALRSSLILLVSKGTSRYTMRLA
ncbi:hypothetical protein EYF80_003070 [Liparis tanakae]|uniref:Uncharacterized protein n=1 Tax=Liparis tanakae TaxID=230148 RepID=A0A4Z2JBA9_9TELE|nr:hypothetical protein EYF80_003070 [Liparis tanakae]